ncbi:MAG: hypothetical protein ACUVWR_13370 [Anaerolineae bacterium]
MSTKLASRHCFTEFTQVAFAAPLWEIPEAPFDMHGDEEMVCLVRITMRNTSDSAKTARLWFNVWPSESLTLEGDNLVAVGRLVPDRPVKRGWRVEPYSREAPAPSRRQATGASVGGRGSLE